MPKTKTDLSRLSLRKDQILELNLAKLPEPPDGMLKLPGVSRWFSELQLARERDIQAFYRMVHTIGTQMSEVTTVTTTTPPPSISITDIISQVISALTGLFIKRTQSDTITGPLYVFNISGSNMRWKNGQLQLKSDNANSSGDQLWHTLRAVYVDDAITPYLDPTGES